MMQNQNRAKMSDRYSRYLFEKFEYFQDIRLILLFTF